MVPSLVSGCGTMLNLEGKEKLDLEGVSVVRPPGEVYVPKYMRPPFAFGGVANDVAWIKESTQSAGIVLSVLDIPFSFIADIVTLPWIAHERLIVAGPRAWDNRMRQYFPAESVEEPGADQPSKMR
jgi:uncharacterized protein YceK